MIVRDIAPGDTPTILALNFESEAVLSPMDAARYAHLLSQSAYARVVDDGKVVAFLLAFREGADYDSPNYRWFAERYDTFLYVDRVVVAESQQGRGLGRLLYDDLFAFARVANVPCITCEFDIDPPNEVSRRLHARYGFEEVGVQTLPKGKRVSLQLARL